MYSGPPQEKPKVIVSVKPMVGKGRVNLLRTGVPNLCGFSNFYESCPADNFVLGTVET